MIYLVLAFMLLHSVCCQDIITTIAGTGSTVYRGDDGPATLAAFNYPYGVTVDASGNLTIIVTTRGNILNNI